jgi:DHA2 family multidrug resistance protein
MTAVDSAKEWKPSFSPWIISFAVMLATFMEVLDSSVANVALPHMSGTFSATSQEVIWVVTSYLVSNAIILPSGAWFSRIFGRKNFLLICIIVFTFASFLCGCATSLEFMIFARILQGLGGGALMPISQAILLESFPPNKRGMAMAIWGLGIIIAPILGPVLGGWITDNYSWQWIFFINIPIGILSAALVNMVIEDPPYIANSTQEKIDFVGFGSLVLWIVSLQVVLDKGQDLDWFNSNLICILSVVSFLAMVFFICWEIHFKDSIIDLRVFCDRNYTTGSVLSTFLGAILYSTLAILPLFLQTLMKYPAFNSGLAIAPRGAVSFFTIPIVGFISDKMDKRILIFSGFVLLGIANLMLGNINTEITVANIIIPNLLMGMALSLIFVPLTAITFATLKKEQLNNATGLFALMRNIGGSVGTSIMGTLLSRNAQTHQAYMVDHLNNFNHVYQQKFLAYKHFFMTYMNPVIASQKADFILYKNLLKQAYLWSYIDNFRLYGILCLLMAPTAFILKNIKTQSSSEQGITH